MSWFYIPISCLGLYIIYLHALMTCPSTGHPIAAIHINIYCFKLNTIAKLVTSPPLQLQLRGVCTLLCFVHSQLSPGLLSMNQIQQCAVQLFFLIPISYFIDILQTEKFTILPIWCLSTILLHRNNALHNSLINDCKITSAGTGELIKDNRIGHENLTLKFSLNYV